MHAAHAAAEGYIAVVVTADDTDVMVLYLAFSAGISCPLFQKCGTRIGLGTLTSISYAYDLIDGGCNSLMVIREYTGCDTV